MGARACELKEQTVQDCTYPDAPECIRYEQDEQDVLSIEWAGARPAFSRPISKQYRQPGGPALARHFLVPFKT